MRLIHILSSTDRPDSNARKIAEFAREAISEHAKARVFSLQDFPLKDVAGGLYYNRPASVDSFNDDFLKADGLLFIIPEYNGGFPGILKLFVDYLPFPEAMEGRPVSLIGEAAGAFGGLRSVEQFEQILLYRKAYIYPKRMFIQRVNKTFDEVKGLESERQQKLLMDQLQGFPGFVERILAGVFS